MYSYLPSLLTPSEVARMFRVDPKTVTRWAETGKLRSIRTMGGHRRYKLEDLMPRLRPLLVEIPAESERPWSPEEETHVRRKDISLVDIAKDLRRPLEEVVAKRSELRSASHSPR